MHFILTCSLFLCAVASALALFNGYFALPIFVSLTAAIYIFIYLNARSTVRRHGFAAALLMLGIGAFYPAVNFWAFGYEYKLVSDAALYDAVANEIASRVPWYRQINPLSYAYVGEIGGYYGEISQPGFFKLLGVGYTIGASLGMEAISLQIPLVLNIASFSLSGLALYNILSNSRVPTRGAWILMLLFMTTPLLIELLVWIRKDLFLLMLSLFTIDLILRRRHPVYVFTLIAVVATIRLPQAALLAILYIVHEALITGWGPTKLLTRYRIFVTLFTFLMAIAATYYSPELNVAPESLAALLEDQEKASFGFSQYLTTNIVGVALYGIMYPFPNLVPQDINALINTIYTCLHLVLLFWIFVMLLPRSRDRSPSVNALWLVLLITLAGYSLQAMMSWKYLGIIVFEGRFKLYGMAITVILFGQVWANRHSYHYSRAVSRRLRAQ